VTELNDTIIFYTSVTNIITIDTVTDESQIWFTIKSDKFDVDSKSIIMISKSGGLLYLAGGVLVSPITSSDGSLSASTGNLVVTLSPAASVLLVATSALIGEVKTKTAGGVVSVIYNFNAKVIQTITDAVA
jgi:hypothetical protein